MAPLWMSYIMTLICVFKVPKFDVWISEKRRESGRKCSRMTFIEVDICHRMVSLRLVYSMTLTFNFKGQTFCYAFAIKKMCRQRPSPRHICFDSHCLAAEWLLFNLDQGHDVQHSKWCHSMENFYFYKSVADEVANKVNIEYLDQGHGTQHS